MDAAKYFIRGVTLLATDPGLQEALSRVYESSERPRCMCVRGGVEMYIAKHGEYRSTQTRSARFAVRVPPGDWTDGAGAPEETIRNATRSRSKIPSQQNRDEHSRQVVIGQRRMAEMSREDHLGFAFTRDRILAPAKQSWLPLGFDNRVIPARTTSLGELVQPRL